ncbi:GTP cyclohydrolase I [Nocardiopsis sp. MT53]|uniref:GTP cyclohydrolase 1 n=1 Tax=Nocardiopsis changdeensis TaxID=2831969 RepID=A0ABX8BQ03_9ACTN|nr:GTP cyclohydrolase I FolE [Nocardiopsis changdeensis]QYX34541.1 GTP cyclohydrolase I [Nocardiopsis sp. MT53]
MSPPGVQTHESEAPDGRLLHRPADGVDTARVAELVRELLVVLGEDPEREGLLATPRRVANWWREFLEPPAALVPTSFSETRLSDQLVVVSGMEVWSLCEHHLLPMRLELTVGYVPADSVLGLSKFARIARRHAGRLQLQERFTRQVAREVQEATGNEDVAVAARGEHLCMSMRGVRMESASTSTVLAFGRLREDAVLSQQFLAFAQTTGSGRPR